jgi:hypothetical protein
MRARLIDLCLLAYPREVRARDRGHLRDLAMDLSEDHGAIREALGLLRGGLAERGRRGTPARRAMVAVVSAVVVTVAGLTWTAAAQGGRFDEDVFSCTGECADTEEDVASRVRDGWDCTDRREPAGASWRCVLD